MKAKKSKNTAITAATSAIILIPSAFGAVVWNRLPERIATSFSASGKVSGYNSKIFAVLGLPAILLAVHLACIFFTLLDPKAKNIHGKLFRLIYFICPCVSLLTGTVIYSYTLGFDLPITTLIMLFLGALFIVIGNYLPKCRQNYSVGIKLPWTLADEEVWNKTHRLAGYMWTAGGAVIMASSFFDSIAVFIGVTAVLAIVPTVYSAVIYRKKNRC